jgi:hypothetical protein
MRNERMMIIEAIRLDEARLAQMDEERRIVNEWLRHLHAQLAVVEVQQLFSVNPPRSRLTKKLPVVIDGITRE